MILSNKFQIRDKVYLVTDIDQKIRLITGLLVRDNSILYEVACGSETRWVCDFEISYEKNVILATTN